MDQNAEPPPELSLSWQCERYNCLPDSGGLYAQDFALLQRMSTLENVHRTVSKLRNMQGKQIHSLTVAERRLIRWLLDNGIL